MRPATNGTDFAKRCFSLSALPSRPAKNKHVPFSFPLPTVRQCSGTCDRPDTVPAARQSRNRLRLPSCTSAGVPAWRDRPVCTGVLVIRKLRIVFAREAVQVRIDNRCFGSAPRAFAINGSAATEASNSRRVKFSTVALAQVEARKSQCTTDGSGVRTEKKRQKQGLSPHSPLSLLSSEQLHLVRAIGSLKLSILQSLTLLDSRGG